MICFEVTRNGQRVCTPGLPEGILPGDLPSGNYGQEPRGWTVSLHVGGVSDKTEIEWIQEERVVGDEVCFKVLEA